MVKLKRLFEHLKGVSDPCVDRALAQALPTADAATLGPMAVTLLQRRQTPGLVALAEQYHRLPEAVQDSVLRHAPELTKALRLALSNNHGLGAANAVNIIRRSGEVRLAYLVADQLRHGQDGLKDASARCLLEMAQRTNPDDGGGSREGSGAGDEAGPTFGERGLGGAESGAGSGPRDAGFVATAVREAVRFYAQHERKDVLLAMFSLPLPELTALLGSLEELGSGWTRATGVLLTRSDTAAVRRGLIPALRVQALLSFSLDGLAMALESGRVEGVLAHWPLLLIKRYRLALKRVKNAERYVPGPEVYKAADGSAAVVGLRGLSVWLGELPMEKPTLVRHLGALSEASDAAVRLGALRKLIWLSDKASPKGQVHQEVARFCTDKEAGIVRVAVTHLIRVKYADITKVLAQLINSPDARVRSLASQRLSPVAFPRLWESWPRLNKAQRLAAGRALIKIDPEFHTALHDKLTQHDVAAKTRALSIVGELNQGLLLQETLVRLSRDSDARVVSAAIKALGSADPDRALPIIERALEHEDDRVRANAVEALAQIDAGRYADQLAAMVHEREANRARANAIQALMGLRVEDAMGALHRMLTDTRAEHRASALWLVETMGIVEVARDVAEMSITEPKADVRDKAGRVIQQIIEQMSQPMPLADLFGDEAEAPGEPGEPGARAADHAAAG